MKLVSSYRENGVKLERKWCQALEKHSKKHETL